jgi:putative endonuclease
MSYIGNLETHNGRIGKLGEDFACEFLKSKGHIILERNLRGKIGEIDIVSEYKGKLHIVEVKTSQSKYVRPEENMNPKKMRKVASLAIFYAKDRLFGIDFIGVTLNNDGTLNKITHLENIEIY